MFVTSSEDYYNQVIMSTICKSILPIPAGCPVRYFPLLFTRKSMFGLLWIVFKILGLAPWRANKRGTFRYNWWSLLTGYGFLLGAVAHYAYSNVHDLEQAKVRDNWKNSATARVVGYIDFGTICITSVTCLVAASSQAKNIFSIIETFQDLKSHHSIPNNPLRFWYALLLGFFILSLYTYDIVTGGLVVCEPLLGVWYLRILLYGSEIIFTSAVLTLYDLLQDVNNKMRLSVMSKSETHQAHQVLPLVDFIKGYGQVGNHPQLTRSPEALRELSAIHWKLCTISTDINAAFNGQLLSLFVTYIVRVVTTPYFVFLMVDTANPPGTEAIVANIGWVFVHTLQLCLLVWPCSLASEEAGKTSTIIVHNLNKPLSPDSRNQMEMFLVQLTNHKLNFNVYNMFTIDLTVMTSVAGAVTTYLVILIQFQNSQTHPE